MPFRDYYFLSSLFLSRLGDQILLFLVPLVVFQITGSISWSGYAFFMEALPRFLSFPICGALCDTRSPYRLIRISQAARAAVCVLGIAGFLAIDGIGWLIGLSAVAGILTTQGFMAREIILAQAFTHHRFEKIASYGQIADQLGMVTGPLLAAMLLTVTQWHWVVIAVAGLFIVADAAMNLWHRSAQPDLSAKGRVQGHWTGPFRIAFRHVCRLPGLKSVICLAAAMNLIIGVTLATAPAMVTGLQGQSELYYGVLQAAGAAATVLVLLFVAQCGWPLWALGLGGYGMVLIGGFMTSFAPSPMVYAIGFIAVIGFDKMFNIFLRTLRKRIVPPADLGKTTGLVILLNNMTQPLAGLLVGMFAVDGDAGPIIAVCATLMLITGVVVACLDKAVTA